VTDWRPLILDTLRSAWPTLPNGVTWIAAQVEIESGGDPRAVSPAGAKGLLQLMPDTWAEVGAILEHGDGDPFDPAENLLRGVTYLKDQYEHFPEIPSHDERYLWSLAAFNGGRGYCNVALALARQDEPSLWWQWKVGRYFLFHRACRSARSGTYPDYRQMFSYVLKIQDRVKGGTS
jgi:soluble lytic murein transglycosylase-like protein